MNYELLKPEETDLIGSHFLENGKVKNDFVAERIFWLIENSLQKVSQDESGWEVLYTDPNDKRCWKLTYPQSNLHGGGSPKLIHVSC